MTIINNIGFKTLGSEEGVLCGSITQNNIPVLEQNYVEKMNANNGFSKQRLFRKIGSIPIAAQLQAIQDGWDMDDPQQIYKYFGKEPDYLSVKAIDTGKSGKIIVK